jgi:hypothetical protein
MIAAKTDPGLYGNDTHLICVMPLGSIGKVDGDDDTAAVRDLAEMPKDVETYTSDVLPREIMKANLSRIGEAWGETV